MDKQKIVEKQLCSIKRACELHENIRGLDESLEKLYPIAVTDNNTFYVFDIMQPGSPFEFVCEQPSQMFLPANILAAFPLEFYHNKAAAVIGARELENPDNHVFIYHEFVHCYQFDHYEPQIKKELEIQRQQASNVMWELNYPFPYEDDVFVSITRDLQSVPIGNEYELFACYHKKMKDHLAQIDYEYMVWQEWKEGYARYVENLIREKLGMKRTRTILSPPFDRVCFYEIGSRYIEGLAKADKTLRKDMLKLFAVMMNPTATTRQG